MGLVLLGTIATALPIGLRPGARSRDDVARDRQSRLDRTHEEIQPLVAEAHAQLPRHAAESVGALYARYSSRFQDSVVDQVRTMLADAVKKKVFVPGECIFFDLATRGCKNDREGLNRLRVCLYKKSVQVVFFFATNRLFRKTYRALQFVEEQIVEKSVRAVFVKSGIDTADKHRWRQMLNMNASMDEFVVGMNADNIRAAHEGLLDKRLVFGTVSFGYAGELIPGCLTRRGRPCQKLIIDPVAGPWVVKVFRWYVGDRLTMAEIVRRLNSDATVPPSPKSPTRTWTHQAVRKLLGNPRYRGFWRYGETETVWVSSKDYSRQVARPEPLKTVQVEAFRLVSDDQWYAAQAFLAREKAKVVGRKAVDGDGKSRPRVLNGLFYCPRHNRMLYVGGVHGKYMICKDCRGLPADQRPLYSQLPRALALRMTCAAAARLIRREPDLVRQVVSACQAAATALQTPNPQSLQAAENLLKKLEGQIRFILKNPGDTEVDQAESEGQLRHLRREKAEVVARIEAAKAAAAKILVVPTESEVCALIERMAEILAAAAASSTLEAAGEVRPLIDLLTGGRIDLEQCGERKAHQGWLRGVFRCPLPTVVARHMTGAEVGGADEGSRVAIDFKPDTGAEAAALSDQVKDLYDQDLLTKEIARRLGIPRSAVTSALEAWFAGHGQERPDGRSRRAALDVKHLAPPLYQSLADRVKAMANEGALFGDIAGALKVDRNTVTSAWEYWHRSRGLPVPDGRTRRKTLARKSSRGPDGSPLDSTRPGDAGTA